jgi:small subunit ribosomal protein S7
MRGRKYLKKRVVQPDLKYRSVIVSKFINKILIGGKKHLAIKIVYHAMEQAGSTLKKEPLEVFEQALKNAGPILEVRSRRIGGATYQVPMEVKPDRKLALAMRWIIQAARDQQGKPMVDFLSQELINAYQNTGPAIKKRDDLHKMAEANKAFAHFARF